METGVEDIEESVEAFGWWRRRDQKRGEDGDGDEDEVVYAGLEEGLDVIAACVLREGPFDGVLGFSQGACAAGMVAALLDSRSARRREGFAQIYAGRRSRGDGFEYPSSFLTSDGQPIQGPLRFAVMYSGFVAPGSRYAPFWTPKIEIASLHVLGGLDTVVSEERSSALMDAFDEDGKVVVRHPGGHFVPSGKVWLNAVVRFIGDVVKGAT